jgi:uncharacterized protein (DUF1800 family)
MGPQPDLVAETADPDAAIERALDLTGAAATPPPMAVPADYDAGRDVATIAEPIAWWIDRMRQSPRLVEERLVWFWHDHFATGLQKVRVPYLMWQQHLLVREHATGNFATMLKAISRDPAMLVYLDGVTNTARERNENFGREVMELFTLGRGNYTEQDVVEASRSFTGWVVNVPGRPAARVLTNAPWTSTFVASRFDPGSKTLLGTTASLDMDGALDVLLAQEATGNRVAAKLYLELVGAPPSEKTVRRLGKAFREGGYEIMPLVSAIIAEPAFLADDAVGAKARSPLEKLVGLVQAVPPETVAVGRVGPRAGAAGGRAGLGDALRTLDYVPFVPPNVAGFPKGNALLGPHQMVHAFDLLAVYPSAPPVPAAVDELFARFALPDVSDRTRAVVKREPDPTRRLALVVSSPEFAVT